MLAFSQRARFANVMQKLPSDMMDEISDVLSDLREHEPYDHNGSYPQANRTFRGRYDPRILRNVTRGDKTPSQLLRYMRNQLGKAYQKRFFEFDHSVNAVRAPTKLVKRNGRWPTFNGKFRAPDLPAPADEDIDPISTETNPQPRTAKATRVFVGFIAHSAMRPGIPLCLATTLVPKPGGEEFRICVDYRKLNASTVPDRYPVPHIHDFASGLMGARIFSKIDLTKAYHQIPVAAEDVPKTAVTTPIEEHRFRLFTRRTGFGTPLALPANFDDSLQTFSKPTSPFVEELRHKMARLKYATPRQQPVNCEIANSFRTERRRETTTYQKVLFRFFDAPTSTFKAPTFFRNNQAFFLEKRQYDANPALRPPNAIPAHPSDAAPQTSNDTPATPVRQTRSGRRVTFPKDLRKYYYY
ncbi:unnamed protein product [Acanthosepion pharaonis]|uniref:Reverse transcriptase domain-containing protein n=1 Tax=Acanthosepion pharaonis TaxID=158019 RepID=A0A812EC66_ACAPH|nr:unnamed protein product [Sepia pharaonis]